MNWFGGELVIEYTNGTEKSFHGLSYEQAVVKTKEVCAEPEKVKWAMYYPYPTDLKAHLLED